MRLFQVIPALCAALAGCGAGDRDAVSRGADLYAATCAVCHGADARGGGGGGVEGLSKTPPDLTGLALRAGGEFPVYDVLAVVEGYAAGGLRGRQMAGFPELQSDDRKRVRVAGTRVRTTPPLGALLVYLESVQAR